jgi:hypothetical protein
MEGSDAAFDDDTPLAGHHALMHPAFGSLPVTNHPPVFEFSDDLDGHLLSREHPLNGVGLAGTDPQVHKIRAQADEPRQLCAWLSFCCCSGRHHRNDSDHQR